MTRPGKEFRTEVVSAVSEAFNNIVLHGYAGRDDGVIEMKIRTGPARISVELRDWGESFDPSAVPLPDLESLPESGLGIYIIRSFTKVEYRAGRPNVLVLSKALEEIMTFSISVNDAGVMRLAIAGELDVVTVSDLRGEIEGLLARQPRRVEVDLSSLRMLDSSGVGTLVSLYKRVRAQGGEVVIVGLRDQPLAIFRLLRLDRVMIGSEFSTQKESSSNN